MVDSDGARNLRAFVIGNIQPDKRRALATEILLAATPPTSRFVDAFRQLRPFLSEALSQADVADQLSEILVQLWLEGAATALFTLPGFEPNSPGFAAPLFNIDDEVRRVLDEFPLDFPGEPEP